MLKCYWIRIIVDKTLKDYEKFTQSNWKLKNSRCQIETLRKIQRVQNGIFLKIDQNQVCWAYQKCDDLIQNWSIPSLCVEGIWLSLLFKSKRSKVGHFRRKRHLCSWPTYTDTFLVETPKWPSYVEVLCKLWALDFH